jgi:hypothetical protein
LTLSGGGSPKNGSELNPIDEEPLWSVTEINKVASFVVLLVAGSILNMITGNVILTSIGCFALGYVLNRGGRPRAPKMEAPQTPVRTRTMSRSQKSLTAPYSGARTRKTLQCRNCGAAISPNHAFCRTCGTKTAAPIRGERSIRKYNPEYIRGKLDEIGDRDEDAYQNLVQDLLLVDDWGRYWSIGAQTSKWYLYENGGWVIDQPVGMMQIGRRTGSQLDNSLLSVLGIEQPASYSTARTTCPSCNSPVNSRQRFCKRCGRRLAQAR